VCECSKGRARCAHRAVGTWRTVTGGRTYGCSPHYLWLQAIEESTPLFVFSAVVHHPLATHYSLPTTHYSLPTTHNSQLTAD
jgi:hypothetical protein